MAAYHSTDEMDKVMGGMEWSADEVAPGHAAGASADVWASSGKDPWTEGREKERSRSPRDAGEKEEFVRRQDLDAWGQEWEKGAIARMQAGMQAGMQAMLAATFRAEVGPLVKRIEESAAAQDRKIDDVSCRVSDVTSNVEDLRDKQERMAEQMGLLAEAVAFASRSKIEPFEHGPAVWERPPDPTILFCGCASLITRKSVEVLFHSELTKLDIPLDGIKVLGNDHTLGKRFKIFFDTGTQGRAATFISKFMDSLRADDGVWRELHVETPSSGPARVFFNRDLSPKQGAIEKYGKKLRNIIMELYPHKDVRLVREEGVVAIDWTPLVKVVAPTRSQITLKWNAPALGTLDIAAEQ